MEICCLFECRYSTLVADLKKKNSFTFCMAPFGLRFGPLARNIDLLGKKVNLKKKHNSNIAGPPKSVLAKTL